MGDTVGGGKGPMGKVRVTEFNGVGEQRGLGSVVHGTKSAVAQFKKMSSRYKIICGCECYISSKSMHS